MHAGWSAIHVSSASARRFHLKRSGSNDASVPNLLLVMLGGAIGAGARFIVGQLAAGRAFPSGTLIINLSGGLLMGLLAGTLSRQGALEGPIWLFLGVGVLGGFTTFSAFSLDAVTLIARGAYGPALAYVAASVLGSLALFAAGLFLTKLPA